MLGLFGSKRRPSEPAVRPAGAPQGRPSPMPPERPEVATEPTEDEYTLTLMLSAQEEKERRERAAAEAALIEKTLIMLQKSSRSEALAFKLWSSGV